MMTSIAGFPLTHPQKRIWYSEQLNPGTAFANIPLLAWLPADLDEPTFCNAIEVVLARYGTLRTQLVIPTGEALQETGEPWQTIHPVGSVALEVTDLGEADADTLRAWAQKLAEKPFLSEHLEANLIRVVLLKSSSGHRALFFVFHHLVGDGWTINLFLGEILAAYKSLAEGASKSDLAAEPVPPYVEFLERENDYKRSGVFQEDRDYWLKKFEELPPEINLSFNRRRSDSIATNRLFFAVPDDLLEKIEGFSAEHRSSMFRIIMAGLVAYTIRASGQRDVAIGIPYHNRETDREKQMFGMFVSTLPLRFQIHEDLDFVGLVKAIGGEVRQSLQHQRYPYDLLMTELREKHGTFGDLLSMNLVHLPEATGGGGLKLENLGPGADPSPLNLYLNPTRYRKVDTRLELFVDYQTALFDGEDICRLVERVLTLLADGLNNPAKRLSEFNIMPEAERRQVVQEFNDTVRNFDQGYIPNATYQELFEATVARHGARTALVSKGVHLTYNELNAKANRLAHRLRELGIGPDRVAAILVDRSADLVVAALAVFKAGGAYLPIDPGYPDERIAYLLEDSDATLLLTQTALNARAKGWAIPRMNVSEIAADQSEANLKSLTGPHDMAYLIYTSGSTGKPKGVMVEHRNLVNLCAWHREFHQVTEKDATAAYSGFGFDASLWEIFPFLLEGAAVHILPEDIRLMPEALNEYFELNGITICNLPTQVCEQFMELTDNRSLRTLVTGGDKLRTFQKRNYRLVNEYGPTEFTISATAFEVTGAMDNIPIGKPLANTWAYVLDRSDNPQPVGIPGELCLAGAQLARGYIGRPELTAEKFVPNSLATGPENALMYRTGDLVRWKPDGNLEFLGRIDQQVKIRGYRIELGEIEQQILAHPNIQDTVVADLQDGSGQAFLCAYVVLKAPLEWDDLKRFLARELPDYMVPSHFLTVDRIPLTANGKVDRRALPKPEGGGKASEYVAPRTETEEKLAALWGEMLGLPRIGINDSFFGLGGHSLKLTILAGRVQNVFGVRLAIADLFRLTTVREQAERLDRTRQKERQAIRKAPEQKRYPLSSAQVRMYVVNQMEGISTSYNMTSAFIIEGPLDLNRAGRALHEMVQRHESLRTSFVQRKDGTPVQVIHPSVKYSRTFRKAKEEDLPRLMKEFIRPFDLAITPLFRIELVELEEERHALLFDVHHIIFDGLSLGIFMNELLARYEGKPLPEASLQYRDFTVWQKAYQESAEFKLHENYWLERFQGDLPLMHLPANHAHPPVRSYEGEALDFQLNKDLTEKVKKLASETGSTLYMVFLAAFYVLLHRYNGQEDIVVGSVASGRTQSELEGMVGMFVNTMPLRAFPEGKKSLADFLNEVRSLCLNAVEHQDYPFEQLVERLKLERDPSRNPLFDVMFTLDPQVDPEDMGALKLRPYPTKDRAARFDLALNVKEGASEFDFSLIYYRAIFDKETVQQMGEHYITVLREMTTNPAQPTCELELMSQAERHTILESFNHARLEVQESTYHAWFEAAVQQHPERVALVCGETRLSYRELNAKANGLARRLRESGVGPDGLVAILVKRSADLVIGALATFKAGGAYLPIDPAYPDERIAYLLEDSGARLLLTHRELRARAAAWSVPQLDLGNLESPVSPGHEANLEPASTPENLAYVIYTSGSTGKPKGVMIEHRNMVNLCAWHHHFHQTTQEDRATAYAGFGFDASVWEIFPFLLKGASVHVLTEELRLSIPDLNDYFEVHGITAAFLPTQVCEQFMEQTDNQSLRVLMTGGDKLRSFRKRNYTLINMYGPTEFTVAATEYEVTEASENIPIGRPLGNTWAYVLDRNGNLQPVGLPGELCVAGAQLARGYLWRPELTAEKFVPNPFATGPWNARMYRTGDLVRWKADGNLEFLGRIDQQVKIRGYRIELGEIEQQMLRHPDVQNAVVIDLKDDAGNPYLCGYAVLNSPVAEKALTSFLAQELPDYMIPSRILTVDQIPLTANGKVDRRTLPKPEGGSRIGEYVAPITETEEKLAALWGEILHLPQVSVEDRFMDLGGHSLKLTILAARIEMSFGTRLAMADLFRLTTVRQQAECLDRTRQKARQAIHKAPERKHYPLSSSQVRMYVLNQMEGVSTAYNITSVSIIEGPLDLNRASRALEEVIQRHEALRTSFMRGEDGTPVQVIHPSIKYERSLKKAKEKELQQLLDEFSHPFDLSKAPLFRVELVQLEEDRHALLLDMHHIIFDGLSLDIFLKELLARYAGRPLPEVSLQYRDFAVWQEAYQVSDDFKSHKNYWLERFEGALPVLHLPVDHAHPAVRSFEGDTLNFQLDRELSLKLRRLAAETGSTLNMLFLAAYYVLLHRYSGQEDIVVGSPASGRTQSELEGMVGMFVNTLPMRAFPEGQKRFVDFLDEVRNLSLDAVEHQDYPFEHLVERLKLERDPSRNPLFDVMFSMEPGMAAEKDGEVRLSPWLGEQRRVSQFDLTLTASESGEEIHYSMEYCTRLFERETILRMGEHFRQLLQSLATEPAHPIGALNLLPETERKLLLEGFNRTKAPLPIHKTIQEKFSATALHHPSKSAMVFASRTWTYQELDEMTNNLAQKLRELGVGPESIVAILVQRSPAILLGTLAVLKAGGAYLPIDAGYPPDRIRFMLEDSQAQIILSQAPLKDLVERSAAQWMDLDDESLYVGNGAPLAPINKATDPAYVIYTSGSTGKPKGVVVDHWNVLNLCAWHHHFHRTTPEDRSAAYSGFGFDASVWEIFPFLLEGAEVHILPEEIRLSIPDLNDYFEKHGITITNLPTQVCEQFIESTDNRSLRTLVTGGDKLRSFRERNYRLVNEYGPTEFTISATAYEVTRAMENIPIGKPLANTWAYVLNQSDALQPVGIPGELCLAGTQLARGYLRRPELTAEKFVPNPFATRPENARMYRTGDLVRWKPDGNLEFLGRIDFQVKIRGYRIELGEIERQLLKYAEVKDAVIEAIEDEGGDKCLVAYVVPRDPEVPPEAEELRNHLHHDLPEYMLPSHFTILEAIPLTPNGKVDRRALPRPSFKQAVSGPIAMPTTQSEIAIAKVWREVLGLSQVGIHDNFFSLGGHSLKAVSVVAKLQTEFAITVNDLFEHQTIASLARNIQWRPDHLKARLRSIKEQLAEWMESGTKEPKFLAEQAPYRITYEAGTTERMHKIGHRKSYKNVLLAGATGFLGIHLLRELLDNSQTQVWVPIRGRDLDDARKRLGAKLKYYFGPEDGTRLANSSCLTVLHGDLSEPHIGLSEETFQHLAATVEAILHSAANVRHYGLYQEFYDSNVKSTQELLTLARTDRPKDFHLVSTVSVGSGDIPDVPWIIFDEPKAFVGQALNNAYLETKMQAEQLVLAAREEGIDARIYRVGNLVFQSGTGRVQENIEENAFYAQIKAFLNLGVIPRGLDEVEFSYVDCTAKALVLLMEQEGLKQETFHVLHPEQVPLSEVLQDRKLNLNLQPTPPTDFIDHLLHHHGKPGFQQHIEPILLHFGWMDAPEDAASTEFTLWSDRTEAFLRKLGFSWPSLDPVWMTDMVNHAMGERVEFLKKVGLFADMEDASLSILAAQGRLLLLEEEAGLLWEGEPNDQLFIIQEGTIEVTMASMGGWQSNLRVLKATDYFGEESIFGQSISSLTAKAASGDVRVLAFPASVVRDLLGRSPLAAMAFLRSMHHQLRGMERLMTSLARS